jgi:deoxyribodipyrimidine photo-lyase
MNKEEIAIFWFRRDLRLTDNAGLYQALISGYKVLPVFIFDENILNRLEDKDDARVTFIHQQITRLADELQQLGSTMLAKYGSPDLIWKQLTTDYNIKAVYTNHDYEPYAKERDEKLTTFFNELGIKFQTTKDHCILEKDEVTKDDGKPYVVFTPYKRKWLEKLKPEHLKAYPTEKYFQNFITLTKLPILDLSEMGFTESKLPFPDLKYTDVLKNYGTDRDFPAKEATSKISIHLRFGTISIRELVSQSVGKSEVWLSELIWRDFYFSILWHFPYSATRSFRPEYDKINWRNNEDEFEAWCQGKTGYPIVDAGMRQLNETGFMHNRIRMVVASFLTKHLLIDWRWGERYFARKLLDFELSSNIGGWQWAAGCGVDAAPYFRIFNPYEQVKKFDKELKYIKKWVPEFADPFKYPQAIVDHKLARERCLITYKKALS